MQGVAREHRFVLDQAATSAIDEELSKRGWRQVPLGDADVYVRYTVGGKSRQEVIQAEAAGIHGTEPPLAIEPGVQRDGVLIIDLLDPQTQQPLWRCLGQGTGPGEQPAEAVSAAVRNGVRRIMADLR